MNEELVYNKIKNSFIDIKINRKVSSYLDNQYDLSKYYEIGKLLSDLIKSDKYSFAVLSDRLSKELNISISRRSLYYIQKFYNYQKVQSVIAPLSWTHYIQLLSLDNQYEINYYINKCMSNHLSVRQLKHLIKSKEYQRLPLETKNKISNKQELTILDEVKNPIIIDSNGLDEKFITERVLQSLITRDMSSFLKQLGDGYAYVGCEYPIKLGKIYNYIDILLFNIKYNCYVVVELKTTKLMHQHIGQVTHYINYIDKNIKNINHNNTIGIIVSRLNDKYVIEYSSDKRIKTIEYKIK